MKKQLFGSLLLSASVIAAFGLTGCNDDDGTIRRVNEKQGAFFISAMGDEAEYLIQTDNVNEGELSINQNFSGDLEYSGYTWIFNTDPSVAVGLIYNKGESGIGLMYKVDSAGSLQPVGSGFLISDRFTSYGFLGDYAVTSVGGVTPLDADGNNKTHSDGTKRTDAVTFNKINLTTSALVPTTIETLDEFGAGEQATFSGIIDLDNGTFMTGVVVSQARDEETSTGGSSTGDVNNPDECWVAILDSNFNIVKKLRTDRISYSSGRYRSQYYSQIGKADDGSIYVFSGSYDYNNNATSLPCGAVRIPKGGDDFDAYYFNIGAKSDGYRFRKVWHITGSSFLLEFYNHKGRLTDVDDPATQYAVVNMDEQSFRWVTGIPSLSQITATGTPMAYDGKMYFPITSTGKNPTIYIIDPATGAATEGLSIYGASSIRAVGRVIEQ